MVLVYERRNNISNNVPSAASVILCYYIVRKQNYPKKKRLGRATCFAGRLEMRTVTDRVGSIGGVITRARTVKDYAFFFFFLYDLQNVIYKM